MQRTVTRMVKVTATYTDDPENEEGQRWDDLRYLTPERILESEKSQLLSNWFGCTEYELVDDVLEVSAPSGDLTGAPGYGPPEYDPGADAARIAEEFADAAADLARDEAREARDG